MGEGWGDPFDELEINLIAEAATRKAALISGAADISPIDLDSREELEAHGLQYPESTVIWINASAASMLPRLWATTRVVIRTTPVNTLANPRAIL